MKQRIFPDYQALSAAAAEEVIAQLRDKPASVLVFPTGNTPLGLFKSLTAAVRAGTADFSRAEVVILDEYAGLAPDDPRALTGWLKRELLEPAGVDPRRIHDFTAGPAAMERKIVSLGGLDLVILGLGPNGHLGFNEPGSAFDSRAREVRLAPSSIASNAAYWGSEDRVPRAGISLGLGTIAEARKIILMVSGAAKRQVLKDAREGPVSPALPATALRGLGHARVFADMAAAGP